MVKGGGLKPALGVAGEKVGLRSPILGVEDPSTGLPKTTVWVPRPVSNPDIRSICFGVQPGFSFRLGHCLAVQPCASYLTSLSQFPEQWHGTSKTAFAELMPGLDTVYGGGQQTLAHGPNLAATCYFK